MFQHGSQGVVEARHQQVGGASAGPGLALVAVLTAIAYASTLVLPNIFGAVTVGLFLGIIVANVRPLPLTEQGAKSAKAWFLPLGILLLGARLSLADILSTGLGAIVVLVIDIVLVLVVVLVGCGPTAE